MQKMVFLNTTWMFDYEGFVGEDHIIKDGYVEDILIVLLQSMRKVVHIQLGVIKMVPFLSSIKK